MRYVTGFLLAAVLAGCGGNTSKAPDAAPTPSASPTDRATVTAAMTRIAHVVHTLQHLSGDVSALEGEYKIAEDDARLAGSQLLPPPAGVPDALARDASAKFTALADSLATLLDCLKTSTTADGCKPLNADGNAKATAAGAISADLLPYSDLTAAQFEAMAK